MSDLYFYGAAAIVTFLLAGFVKGVIGLGLPTVAMGLLSLFLPPAEAAALMIVPSFATNLWQAVVGPHFRQVLRRLWTMMLGICMGTGLGAGMLTGAGSGPAVAGLGAALAIYALLGLTRMQFSVSRRAEPWLSPLAGVVTGLVTGATGVFVIPSAPYIQALDMDRDRLVQAFGLSFTISTIALAAALAAGGSYRISAAGASFLALVPAAAGMFAGQWVRARVSAAAFRACLFGGLLLLGLHLMLRPWI